MDIVTQEKGRATVVSVSGKIDAMTSPTLESALSSRIGEGLFLVLDFGAVSYISSAGLRVILATAKALKGKAGTLVLAQVGGTVKEVFDISGFGSVFTTYDSVDTAVAAAG